MKAQKKNPQVVLAKTYGNREDKKENPQINRKKILSSKAETKDVPPTDGKRPDLKKDYDKMAKTKPMPSSAKSGSKSSPAMNSMTANRHQKQRNQGMY